MKQETFDNTFRNLREKAKKIALLNGIQQLLSWDQETNMPEGASEIRSEQISHLSGLIHAMKTDPAIEKNIAELFEYVQSHSNHFPVTSKEYVILDKMRRDTVRQKCLPQEFVERFAKKTSEAMVAWQKAKKENSWDLFLPHLETVFELAKEKGNFFVQAGLAKDVYTALLDEFEPDADLAFIDQFFSDLKKDLVPLLYQIQERQKSIQISNKPHDLLQAPFEVQKAASEEIINRIGYDWSKSRLDGSSHPFSMALHPTDSRITIRSGNLESSTISQLMSALHEAGHSLYEMGLPIEDYGTPLCEPVSLSIHESQSRLWETVIGRSKLFMPIMRDVIQTIYTSQNIPFSESELADLYNAINWVEPSFIRTEADEVTYPLHVLLRYEIEKELFNGTLRIKDLPGRWNKGMKELFGIEPATDREGCLQDIHWSMGMFGYFPTYTLGSWYAICLMIAMQNEMPTLTQEMTNGNFSSIHSWLNKHIWSQGRRYNSYELISLALGRPPLASDYIEYLRGKYI